MPELVVISGKGGTGKTSVVASLAALAGSVVLADCDVDASDLHLVLEPDIQERHVFIGGLKAGIQSDRCTGCGKCVELCRFGGVTVGPIGNGEPPSARIDSLACEGCGVCARCCPKKAITMTPTRSGDWFVSRTRFGPMVHARLDPAAGNTGKLVSLLRRRTHGLLRREEELILCDGSPGIGCPVIASLTGADLALIVAEPTCSSLHDLERALKLCRHFAIDAVLVVNKWDLNPDVTRQIEVRATDWQLPVIGRLGYDASVVDAQVQRQTVVEHSPNADISKELARLWGRLCTRLAERKSVASSVAMSKT